MKCLVVEDDPILNFTLFEAISEMGHDVVVSHTLSEASGLLLKDKFDIIVLDYRLPDGVSTDLANYAALTQPNCRIILLTGSDVYPEGEHARLAPGIDWVLRKPAPMADLCALIEYAHRDATEHPTIERALI